MYIKKSVSGQKLELLEAGSYPAYLIGVVSLGRQLYKGSTEEKYNNAMLLYFEIPEEKDGDGNPRVLSKEVNKVLHEKSALYQIVDNIDPLLLEGSGLELSDIVGKPISIVVDANDKYNNVKSTARLKTKEVAKMDDVKSELFIIDVWDENCDTDKIKSMSRFAINKILSSQNCDSIKYMDELEARLNELEEKYSNKDSNKAEKTKEVASPKKVKESAKASEKGEADDEDEDMY